MTEEQLKDKLLKDYNYTKERDTQVKELLSEVNKLLEKLDNFGGKLNFKEGKTCEGNVDIRGHIGSPFRQPPLLYVSFDNTKIIQ